VFTKIDKRNTIFYAAGESLWGFQWNLISTAIVLTVILKKLNAPYTMIGAISAIEIGGLSLPQILGPYLFGSSEGKKKKLIFYHFYAMVPFIFFMGILLFYNYKLPVEIVRWGLLIFMGCLLFAIGIIIPVWMDWLATLFRQEIRGTSLGVSFSLAALFGFIGTLFAGYLIKSFTNISQYSYLYFLAGSISICSLFLFLFIDDTHTLKEKVEEKFSWKKILNAFKKSLKVKNFKLYLLGRILFSAGFCILPFVVFFYKSDIGGGLSESVIVKSGAMLTFGYAFSSFLLGKIGDKFGHRIGILIGGISQIFALSLLIFTKGVLSCILVYFFVGILQASGFISHYNILFETCPHSDRVVHITLGNLLINITTVILALLAGIVAQVFSLYKVFLISFFISIFAFIWFFVVVKEPRQDILKNINIKG